MSRPRARTIVFWVMALLVSGFLVFSFKPQPVPVDVAQIDKGDLAVTVSDDGHTRVKELYVVSAPVAGRVLRLEPEVGDIVTADKTLLAVMLPSGPGFLDERRAKEAGAVIEAAEAALQLAIADVERVKAEVEYAEADIARAEALVRTNTASPARLDRARLSLKTAQAQLQTANSGVRMRRADVAVASAALIGPEKNNGNSAAAGIVQIVAPIDGAVLVLRHESEGIVAAGTPLIELGDPSKIEVIADFLSHQAVNVKVGAEVFVEAWGGEPLKGHVRLVEPKGFTKVSALGIEEQRVNIIIDFESNGNTTQSLGHGFRVEPRIVLWQGRDILRVPVAAIFRHESGWGVFKEVEGRALLTPVTLGKMNDSYSEILSGLHDGDVVVLHPSESVADDIAISPRGD